MRKGSLYTRGQVATLALSSILVALLGVFMNPANAQAGTAQNVGYLQIGDDYFINHDFYGKTYSSDNVDWMMNYLFYGSASQSGIEDVLLAGTYWQDATAQFGNKYNWLNNNNGGWIWEGADGKTTSRPGCGSDRYHYRPYAPNDQNFYDPTSAGWGYWVVASSHRDHNDGCKGWSGNSEDAEKDISKTISSLNCGPNDHPINCNAGRNITRNYLWTGDPRYGDDVKAGSKHRWQTNGYATVYRM
jgi:hypothetical protein